MRLIILSDPRKYLRKLADKERQRLISAILALPKGDVRPLVNEDSAFRLRVGDWRVMYHIKDGDIIIRKIGSRGDIYK
ncbi:MAG: type II toxin-antitoxin system RelE/ParE family toxin [Defluviitaleaceae bacterium]|nr:type II toxin-antitoxin system RelE/ParE family toxin [Defluviitaleaceae bacterium]MCL2262158.1 type II toxin-antitoxin system RelE/ParE family toxin [Defluviitaleaceae bacterium]